MGGFSTKISADLGIQSYKNRRKSKVGRVVRSGVPGLGTQAKQSIPQKYFEVLFMAGRPKSF